MLQIDNVYPLSAGIELFAALFTGVLLFGYLTERRHNERTDKLFIAILVAQIALLMTDAAVWMLLNYHAPERVPLVKALTLFTDATICVMTVLYSYFLTYYISQTKKVSFIFPRLVTVACVMMILLWIVCLFNDLYIGYDVDGSEYNGPLYAVIQLVGSAMLGLSIVYTLAHIKILGWRDAIILSSYGALPLLANLLEWYWPVTPPLLATTLSLLLVYVVIHTRQTHRAARQEIRLVRQELELQDSRTKIMLSQIQPHFLYNALCAIQDLCHGKAPEAEEATVEFSEFLRSNLDSLAENKPILFEKELQHVRNYLSLEQKRFRDALRVEYAIGPTLFSLPAMTLQPIVENAVRYGVMRREDGGTVLISTEERDSEYRITVKDDGVGFDVNVPKADGRSHVGINNVRDRLKRMCGGTLHIESIPGEGTTAVIAIPCGKDNDDEDSGGRQ